MKLHILGIVCAATAMTASADYLAGLDAYNSKDFAKAKQEFLLAAELGDAKAQRVLSTMYAKGEGGPMNAIDAYAWAAVAALEDTDVAAKIRDTIGAQLPPGIKAQAEKRATELMGMYSRPGLENRMLPQLNSNEPTIYDLQYAEAMLKSGVAVDYPTRAREKGDQGVLCASFYLDADGKPIAPAAFEPWAKPSVLAGSTEKQLESWRFQAGKPGVRYAYCLDFLIEDDKTWADFNAVEKQLQSAAGNRNALVALAKQLSAAAVSPRGRVDPKYATQAWRDAAMLGDVQAAYETGSRLLRGDGCRRDRVKGLRWMDHAARAGSADAKAYLALRLQADDELKLDPAKQQQYLSDAAASGHAEALLHQATQQLKSKDPNRWAEAVASLARLSERLSISVWDWRAYGLALIGEFEEAAELAEDALEFAQQYNLEQSHRQQAFIALQENRLPPAPK
ncbi:hypothetical protein E2H98_10825 [Permianibacter aggregans]|uniref:TonB-like protein n=2 Tax=Permianibacter aggregans TaxID=1510150 RepID=A0A4R6UT82_9GAMM|nr:hypothetical protein E2H98_10825 [Permianibacter aggregans]TDQ49049.1 TonB-like protein [Permianibacter aggregans]